jgi:hypothetical protein
MTNPRRIQPVKSVVEQLMSIIDSMNNGEDFTKKYFIYEFHTSRSLMVLRCDNVTLGVCDGWVAETNDGIIEIPFEQQYKQKIFSGKVSVECYVN